MPSQFAVFMCMRNVDVFIIVLMFSHETYQLANGSLMASKFPFLSTLQFQFFTNLCFCSRLFSFSLTTFRSFQHHRFNHYRHFVRCYIFNTTFVLHVYYVACLFKRFYLIHLVHRLECVRRQVSPCSGTPPFNRQHFRMEIFLHSRTHILPYPIPTHSRRHNSIECDECFSP